MDSYQCQSERGIGHVNDRLPYQYQSVLIALLVFEINGLKDRVRMAQCETLSGIRIVSIRAWRRSGEEELFVDL